MLILGMFVNPANGRFTVFQGAATVWEVRHILYYRRTMEPRPEPHT